MYYAALCLSTCHVSCLPFSVVVLTTTESPQYDSARGHRAQQARTQHTVVALCYLGFVVLLVIFFNLNYEAVLVDFELILGERNYVVAEILWTK